jgi:CRP-like cAMP-binding protein
LVESTRLSAIPLFADLPEEDRELIAEAAGETEAAVGDALVTEGDFGYALYAIESGTAVVTHDGEEIRTLGPGDVFGEIAVIASGRRTATVVATSPMRLITLFNRDVWRLERTAPDAAKRLRALVEGRRALGDPRRPAETT